MRSTWLAALVLSLALTLGAADTALAQDNARARCIREAARAGLLGRDLNPGHANFVLGTDADDNFSGRATAGRDVFCGFGGDDEIDPLNEGDVFLGGDGDDHVGTQFGGTFNGGAGDDSVGFLQAGTFNGGPGTDFCGAQTGGICNP
jgi:hypothetical protein